MPGGTIYTDFGVAFILTVTVAVGGAVFQRLILRADNAIVVFIVDILVSGFLDCLRRLPRLASLAQRLLFDNMCLLTDPDDMDVPY